MTSASDSWPGCTRSRRPGCGSPGSEPCRSRSLTSIPSSIGTCRGRRFDMDFMNLNQSAHGDREFGFIWQPGCGCGGSSSSATGRIPPSPTASRVWARAACALARGAAPQGRPFRRQHARRRSDRGRQDRGAASTRLRRSTLRSRRPRSGGRRRSATRTSTRWWRSTRTSTAWSRPSGTEASDMPSLREAARIELGLRQFLAEGGFMAFTDTFEDLGGLVQLPGHRRPATDGRRLRLRRRR